MLWEIGTKLLSNMYKDTEPEQLDETQGQNSNEKGKNAKKIKENKNVQKDKESISSILKDHDTLVAPGVVVKVSDFRDIIPNRTNQQTISSDRVLPQDSSEVIPSNYEVQRLTKPKAKKSRIIPNSQNNGELRRLEVPSTNISKNLETHEALDTTNNYPLVDQGMQDSLNMSNFLNKSDIIPTITSTISKSNNKILDVKKAEIGVVLDSMSPIISNNASLQAVEKPKKQKKYKAKDDSNASDAAFNTRKSLNKSDEYSALEGAVADVILMENGMEEKQTDQSAGIISADKPLRPKKTRKNKRKHDSESGEAPMIEEIPMDLSNYKEVKAYLTERYNHNGNKLSSGKLRGGHIIHLTCDSCKDFNLIADNRNKAGKWSIMSYSNLRHGTTNPETGEMEICAPKINTSNRLSSQDLANDPAFQAAIAAMKTAPDKKRPRLSTSELINQYKEKGKTVTENVVKKAFAKVLKRAAAAQAAAQTAAELQQMQAMGANGVVMVSDMQDGSLYHATGQQDGLEGTDMNGINSQLRNTQSDNVQSLAAIPADTEMDVEPAFDLGGASKTRMKLKKVRKSGSDPTLNNNQSSEDDCTEDYNDAITAADASTSVEV